MALNVQALSERLRQYEEGAKASEFAKLIWRPKEGTQVVRIVPYFKTPENPLIELQFYYKLAGNNYLAPCTFGKPDPIIEVIESLRASGSNEEKLIAAKLAPTRRIYVPVIVRGEEELGVRFWGFGVQVHQQLLRLMTETTMWGDITSVTNGNDLKVEFHKIGKKKNIKGESFPETIIMPNPNKSPVVDPTRKDLMEKVKNQSDILNVFPLKTYEELKAIVNNYLNPTEESAVEPNNNAPAAQTPTVIPAAVSTPTDAATTKEFESFFAVDKKK